MSLFSEKYIIEFEFSKSFLGSYKKATMVIEATSEISAMSRAKSVLKANYPYVHVLSAHKSSGKAEERKVTFAPTIKETKVAYSSPKVETSSLNEEYYVEPKAHKYTEEELVELDEKRKEREKEYKISRKQAEIKRTKFLPFLSFIIGIPATLFVFLLSWIPHWVNLYMAETNRSALSTWIELGHSETDEFGQECIANIQRYSEAANNVLWVPFVALGVCLVIVAVIFIASITKSNKKIVKLNEELKKIS